MTKAIPRLLFLLLTVIAGLCLPGMSQGASPQKSLAQMPASARQLIAIKVVGSKRFPEAAIAAATGLQMGTAVNDDDFKKAARRLGDMGVFTEIAYTFSYSSAGTKLELHVTDADKFVPAHFEDFVWFTDERAAAAHPATFAAVRWNLAALGSPGRRSFRCAAGHAGGKLDPGHVEYQRTGKPDGPVDSINYHVTDVLIQVRKIEFTGAADAEVPALEDAAERLPDHEYSRTRLNQLVQRQLLPVYLRARIPEGGVRRAATQSCEAAGLSREPKTGRATRPSSMSPSP